MHPHGITDTAVNAKTGASVKWLKRVLLQIPVLSQPVCLRRQVAVDDITFFILERPGSNNEYIAFPYPDPLLDLPLDPAHAGNAVIAPDTDMICTHHKICKSELFISPFLG